MRFGSRGQDGARGRRLRLSAIVLLAHLPQGCLFYSAPYRVLTPGVLTPAASSSPVEPGRAPEISVRTRFSYERDGRPVPGSGEGRDAGGAAARELRSRFERARAGIPLLASARERSDRPEWVLELREENQESVLRTCAYTLLLLPCTVVSDHRLRASLLTLHGEEIATSEARAQSRLLLHPLLLALSPLNLLMLPSSDLEDPMEEVLRSLVEETEVALSGGVPPDPDPGPMAPPEGDLPAVSAPRP